MSDFSFSLAAGFKNYHNFRIKMIDEILAARRAKLEAIRERGIDPYPPKSHRDTSLSAVFENFDNLSSSEKKITVAGRILGFRDQGKIVFIDIDDGSARLQLVLAGESVPDLDFWKSVIDIGDFIESSGVLFITKRGEKSLKADTLRMLSKSLRPLPSDFYGLEDTETRLRKRYLELVLDTGVREMFRKKAVYWETFRNALLDKGFLEVETPVLELTPGGAEAEPFVTRYNALDTDFYLRISLEISLKKLMVGGYEKVFEIGRIFRNEGIDADHLQDYTQLEFYWAYTDYEDLMTFINDTYQKVIEAVNGSTKTTWRGTEVNWSGSWPKIDYFEIFEEKTGINLKTASDADLLKKAVSAGLKADETIGRGRLIDLLFKKFARPHLIQPAFLVNPPIEIEPLAKRIPGDSSRVYRFQVVACGSELGKGFSEANDPIDERERFEDQMKLREKGDAEAQMLDEDFLEALEYGMPPMSGFGISERLFAFLMDKPIRETVFFPPMRRKQ